MAVTTTNTVEALEGLYKTVYGEGPDFLAPDNVKLLKDIPFSEAERVGKQFAFPVVLQLEQGYTYGGADGDAFALNDAASGLMDEAYIDGSFGILRTQMSYRAATKAASSQGAFKRAMSVSLEMHQKSHVFRRELELLYGRSPTGLATTTASSVSGTTVTLTVSAATWAVGIWAGMEGAKYNAWNVSSGAKLADSANVDLTLTSVDPDNRQLVFTAASAQLATNIDAVEALYVDFAGTRATFTTTHKQHEGLDYIVTLASGNTLHGISTNYTLWRGNSYACGSAKLTLQKVLAAANKAVGKAGLAEKCKLWVSPETWADLADSISATRMTDSSYSTSEGKNGVEKVIYHGASGAIEVSIHPIVKGGEAFLCPMKHLKRIGSSDISLKNPANGNKIFLELASSAGFEYRSISDFALLCDAPGKFVKLTGIVNS
jgi:hypothetical protein